MNTEIPNNYIITYSNYLKFEGRKLAFRKRELFDITDSPIWIPFNEKANCWIVNRKQLSKSKAEDLIIKQQVTVDVSNLQWYEQEQLNGCFNLK
jgi:hypothetical protein